MKLPVAWLKEYLDVTLAPEKLADILTMSGTKVEEVKGHVFHKQRKWRCPRCGRARMQQARPKPHKS